MRNPFTHKRDAVLMTMAVKIVAAEEKIAELNAMASEAKDNRERDTTELDNLVYRTFI